MDQLHVKESAASATVSRPIICAVTDRRRFGEDVDGACEALARWSGAVARAGVSVVQIREYDLDDARLVELVRAILLATRDTGARVLVSDRTDVALAAGAAGVHLPAAAPPADRVRRIVPDGFIIGRSVHEEGEAVAAAQSGACDYLTFGTVFRSPSKPAGHPVAGLDVLACIAARVSTPVVAIGGISRDRALDVARAGASGIAAISLFGGSGAFGAGDVDAAWVRYVQETVRALNDAFAYATSSHGAADIKSRLDAPVRNGRTSNS